MKNSRARQALRLERALGEEMPVENRDLTALLAHYREDRQTKKALLRMLRSRFKDTDGRMAWLLALAGRL